MGEGGQPRWRRQSREERGALRVVLRGVATAAALLAAAWCVPAEVAAQEVGGEPRVERLDEAFVLPEDTRPLMDVSLQAALTRAVASNPTLVRSRVAVRRAEVLMRGEGVVLSPVLRLESSYAHSDEPTRGLFESGLRISDVSQLRSSWTKRLTSGADVSVQFDLQRLRSVQPFALPDGTRQVNLLGPQWSESLSLTLRQPLMRGLGRDVNLISQDLARQQLDAAEAARVQAASQMTLELLVAYFELIFAQRTLDNQRRQLVLAKEQRDATEALIEAGRLAEVERDVIAQRLLVIEESLLVASGDRDRRQGELQRLVGDPTSPDSVRWRPSTAPELPQAVQPLDALIAQLDDVNADLLALREQVKAQRLATVTSLDATKPQLDVSLSVTQRGLSQTDVIDATEQVATLQAGTVLVGVSLTSPWDNGRAEAQYEGDRLRLDELEVQYQETRARIANSLRDALRSAQVNRRRVTLGDRSVDLALRGLNAEQARFKAGLSTNQSVIQFQEQLQEAESRRLRARVDLALARAQVHHLSGQLLGVLNIEVY